MSAQHIRAVITVNGIVQGVGFRPFVYSLAHSCDISGWVNNFPGGVHIEAEGTEEIVQTFIRRLQQEAPRISSIDTFQVEYAAFLGYSGFEIRESSLESANEAYISADIGVCADCLQEMNNPRNKRYRYPFINCTNCGPRFTITSGIPYDRANTTMSTFPMCRDCADEYHNPSDRRFHAQPVACSLCGPRLFLLDAAGKRIAADSELDSGVELLNAGKILAIKGLGGYHIACDAKNNEAVKELRKRKARDGKPFALMAKNIEVIHQYCFVNEQELGILQGFKRPIVLLEKRPDVELDSQSISPDNNKIGIMLPYTPLHHLLFDAGIELLVMTSGNLSGEPIYYKDDEAIERMRGIADYFLTNNREIYIRADDSVTSVFRNKELIIRRSRGYVPFPLDLSSAINSAKYPLTSNLSVLACGSQLKNTFCLTKGGKAFLSHHIGDLENIETLQAFETGICHFKKIFSAVPQAVAFDKHPDYLSTIYADGLRDITHFPIQHHHAHIASCMAENGIVGKVIGVAFDGTGYGDDGKIWGGEFFTGDYSGFERRAHFEYVPLPGGEVGIKEPWRMAVSYLVQAYGDAFPHSLPFLAQIGQQKVSVVLQQIEKRINTPLTSSAGRLFDGISALVGLCSVIEYEGQAAIRLEKEAKAEDTCLYPYEIITGEFGYQIRILKMIRAIVGDVLKSTEISHISGAFHRTIACIILDVCRLLRDEYGLEDVVLSGGVFQNRFLLGITIDELEKNGFKVYTHSKVPTNDGGISLGQAAIALHKLTGMRRNLWTNA